MELLVKTATLGIAVSILGLFLRKYVPEMGLVLSLAASVTIGAMALGLTSQLREFAELVRETAGISAAITGPVLKCVGLGILANLACNLCRDAGQAALAGAVELTGTLAALYVALPLFHSFLDLMEGLL